MTALLLIRGNDLHLEEALPYVDCSKNNDLSSA
jgi:hypothetical protein